MLRVRRDHTCVSLNLNDSDLCDKCCTFRQRQSGMGRHLPKNDSPKCEKPWFLNEKQMKQTRLVNKKKKYLSILKSYNFKLRDEACDKEIESRLHGMDYRKNWLSKGLKKAPHLKPLFDDPDCNDADSDEDEDVNKASTKDYTKKTNAQSQ